MPPLLRKTLEFHAGLETREGLKKLQSYGIDLAALGIDFSEQNRRVNGPYHDWFEQFHVKKIKGGSAVKVTAKYVTQAHGGFQGNIRANTIPSYVNVKQVGRMPN